MSNIKVIRDRLGLTQTELAKGMGCTQGNVGHYERGQTVPPDAAKRLIGFAESLGTTLSFDDIYGAVISTVRPSQPGTVKSAAPRVERRDPKRVHAFPDLDRRAPADPAAVQAA